MKFNWLENLKAKWSLNGTQVLIVLIVFACTGFTVLFLKKPILALIIPTVDAQWWHSLIYYIFILPIYNVVLLFYGFIFGQFSFFWQFEKRMFSRIFGTGKSK